MPHQFPEQARRDPADQRMPEGEFAERHDEIEGCEDQDLANEPDNVERDFRNAGERELDTEQVDLRPFNRIERAGDQ